MRSHGGAGSGSGSVTDWCGQARPQLLPEPGGRNGCGPARVPALLSAAQLAGPVSGRSRLGRPRAPTTSHRFPTSTLKNGLGTSGRRSTAGKNPATWPSPGARRQPDQRDRHLYRQCGDGVASLAVGSALAARTWPVQWGVDPVLHGQARGLQRAAPTSRSVEAVSGPDRRHADVPLTVEGGASEDRYANAELQVREAEQRSGGDCDDGARAVDPQRELLCLGEKDCRIADALLIRRTRCWRTSRVGP